MNPLKAVGSAPNPDESAPHHCCHLKGWSSTLRCKKSKTLQNIIAAALVAHVKWTEQKKYRHYCTSHVRRLVAPVCWRIRCCIGAWSMMWWSFFLDCARFLLHSKWPSFKFRQDLHSKYPERPTFFYLRHYRAAGTEFWCTQGGAQLWHRFFAYDKEGPNDAFTHKKENYILFCESFCSL